MLTAVRIARPKDQDKWFAAILEYRQNHTRGNGGKRVLLHDGVAERSGCRHVSGLAVFSPRRRRQRQCLGLKAIGNLRGERNTLWGTRGVVDEYRFLAGALRRVEDQGRADLADRSRAVALSV